MSFMPIGLASPKRHGSVFVPLPVVVSCWQSFFGSGGLLPVQFWASGMYRPWATGWGPAIWVHAVAATPWVLYPPRNATMETSSRETRASRRRSAATRPVRSLPPTQ